MNLKEIIYNFLFDYKIHSSFAAFLRIALSSYFMLWVLASAKDIFNFTKPLGIFNRKVFKNIQTTEITLVLFSVFDYIKDSKFLHKFIFFLFFSFGLLSLSGLFTNISLTIFFLLYISIQNRVYPILMNNGSTIEKLMLFCLIFIDCGSQYSLDNFFGISSNMDSIDGWGARIIQITIPIIYYQSAKFKNNDPAWETGNAIKYTLMMPGVCRSLVKYIYPFLISKGNYFLKKITKSVKYLEFLAPILFILPETRWFALIYFFLMHLTITLIYKIDYFGPTMIMALLFFLNEYFY